MTATVYLVGEPGAGKTTLAAALRSGWSELTMEKRPLRHVLWQTPAGHLAAELGWPRGTFSGTDSLPMDAVRHAEPWISSCGYPLVLGEGDRLACDRFLRAAADVGPLAVVHVATPAELAAERRALRGTEQDRRWLEGRRTKVGRLVERWAEHVVAVDGALQPAAMAAQVRAAVPQLVAA